MKLFMWYGSGVLEDYTSGQITVLANDLEEAIQTIKNDDYHSSNSFPKEPTEIVDLNDPDLKPKAWLTWGGG